MRELRLRVAADEVEEALDTLLPVLSGGVHLRSDGGTVEVKVLETPGTPGEAELAELLRPWLREISVVGVSDDWRERRLARYEPLVIADRFLVRPDWAPPAPAGANGLIEIVIERSTAFGTGVHPTTQACLAALAEATPGGSLADLGCGSGVLSIAAAKLGWAPVLAVDLDEASVAAARANAKRNGVEIDTRRADLAAEAAPAADAVLANVPPGIHFAVAASLPSVPSLVVASGFKRDDLEAVEAAWRTRGLRVTEERAAGEWQTLVMR